MSRGLEFERKIKEDFCRLAQFGANLADAHSCFVFIPNALCEDFSGSTELDKSLRLVGYHSLSNDIVSHCKISCEAGLIGWVAKHMRSIHVSPFEHDSRTLGTYLCEQQLKSFIGVPVQIEQPDISQKAKLSGVLACDSKKSYAFSKMHGKLLENLSKEVSNTFSLLRAVASQRGTDTPWEFFLHRCQELSNALGMPAIEILRLKPINFEQIESTLGTAKSIHMTEQVQRLIQQALPPHFPCIKLLNGDIVLALDNMMTSFYENKIRAIASHIAVQGLYLDFAAKRVSYKSSRTKKASLEQLIAESALVSENVMAHAVG